MSTTGLLAIRVPSPSGEDAYATMRVNGDMYPKTVVSWVQAQGPLAQAHEEVLKRLQTHGADWSTLEEPYTDCDDLLEASTWTFPSLQEAMRRLMSPQAYVILPRGGILKRVSVLQGEEVLLQETPSA